MAVAMVSLHRGGGGGGGDAPPTSAAPTDPESKASTGLFASGRDVVLTPADLPR
eukprot:SAG11_NODE_12335_length_708_cov_1.633826_1_plen_53_part_10